LTVGLATQHEPPLEWLLDSIPFSVAETNFYRAARDGLEARLLWPVGALASPTEQAVPALVTALLPLAAVGLDAIGVEPDELRRLLTVIEARVRSGQTGARWQRRALAAFEARGADRSTALHELVRAYTSRSASGTPVHLWDLPA
jgi:hypothetical protein